MKPREQVVEELKDLITKCIVQYPDGELMIQAAFRATLPMLIPPPNEQFPRVLH